MAGVTRRFPLKLAIAAGCLAVIPPPFFWPAVGVLVLVMHGLTTEAGFRRRPGAVQPGPAAPAHT